MKTKSVVLAVMVLLFPEQQGEAQEREAERERKTQILFVCEHGYAKSLMAACYFNQLTEAQHLPYRAVARGVAPDSVVVPARIAEGLSREGFDVSDFHPLKVGDTDLERAHRIIVIGTQLGNGPSLRNLETWNDVPAASEDFNASLRDIKRRVGELLARLSVRSETSRKP